MHQLQHTYIYTHTTHAFTHACTHTHTKSHTYHLCMHARTHTHTHTYRQHTHTHTQTHTHTCTSQVQKVFGGGGAGLLSPIHGQGLNLDPTDWIHRQPNILLCAWTQNSHTRQSWLFFTYFSRSGIKSIIQVLRTLNTYMYTRTGMHAPTHT